MESKKSNVLTEEKSRLSSPRMFPPISSPEGLGETVEREIGGEGEGEEWKMSGGEIMEGTAFVGAGFCPRRCCCKSLRRRDKKKLAAGRGRTNAALTLV